MQVFFSLQDYFTAFSSSELSKKQKTLFKYFAAYLKSTSNIEHFSKKYDRHRLRFSK